MLLVAHDARGRAAAGGADGRHDIREVRRLAPRLRKLRRTPAVVAARHAVIEAAWLVPRQPDATFVVRIVGEQLAVEVEVETISVAEAVADDLDRFAVRADAEQAAGDGVLHRRTLWIEVFLLHAGHVAAQQVEPAIRAAANRVGLVFAAAFSRRR